MSGKQISATDIFQKTDPYMLVPLENGKIVQFIRTFKEAPETHE